MPRTKYIDGHDNMGEKFDPQPGDIAVDPDTGDVYQWQQGEWVLILKAQKPLERRFRKSPIESAVS